MTIPTVSVIVTVYNGARYLAQALESISKQTFKDFEVIVVDDASTDESGDIAQAFSERDPRIHAFSLPFRVGGAAAFNEGLHQATGLRVAFLAADDYWLPEFLEWSLAALAEDSAGVYTDFIVWDEARGTKRVVHLPNFSRETFVYGDYVNFSALLFRYPFFLDPKWEPVADWEGLLRLTADRPLRHLQSILSVRRIHGGQVSQRRRTAMVWKSFLLAFRHSPRAGLWRLGQALSWPIVKQVFK